MDDGYCQVESYNGDHRALGHTISLVFWAHVIYLIIYIIACFLNKH